MDTKGFAKGMHTAKDATLQAQFRHQATPLWTVYASSMRFVYHQGCSCGLCDVAELSQGGTVPIHGVHGFDSNDDVRSPVIGSCQNICHSLSKSRDVIVAKLDGPAAAQPYTGQSQKPVTRSNLQWAPTATRFAASAG